MKKQAEKTKHPAVIIRRTTVEQWSGLADAAKLLGRTTTQIRRHVSGECPSRALQKRMDKIGITVEE